MPNPQRVGTILPGVLRHLADQIEAATALRGGEAAGRSPRSGSEGGSATERVRSPNEKPSSPPPASPKGAAGASGGRSAWKTSPET